MENYNPFGKSLENIQGSDLQILLTVTEGWYVDYKQQSISLEKFAKHISSFANQYGGWLFIGIKESAEMTAEEFNGIPTKDIAATLVKIRESISKYVNPDVYFETKIINGPVKEIGLAENKSIIVIGIPEGTNPPYIHRNGKIYRRVADQSEPVAETDRFILDQLWKRGTESKEKLKHFIKSHSIENKTQDNPILNIYFLTNPTFSNVSYNLGFNSFKNFMISTPQNKIAASLETIFTASGGYIGRQIKGNNPLYHALSFRWWQNGNARGVIPINILDNKNVYQQYRELDNFYFECKKSGITTFKFSDFNYLLLALIALFEKFFDIYEYLKIDRQICIAAVISNTWRTIPFIDSHEYIKMINENGIPVIQDETIIIPDFFSNNSLLQVSNRESDDVEQIQSKNTIIACLPLMVRLLNSIGINLDINEYETITRIFVTLLSKK